MAEFRVVFFYGVNDLTGGFGGTRVGSRSEIFHGSLEDAISKAEVELEAWGDYSGTNADLTCVVAIYERNTVKVWGFIPVTSEQLVWQGGEVAKGALLVRVVA